MFLKIKGSDLTEFYYAIESIKCICIYDRQKYAQKKTFKQFKNTLEYECYYEIHIYFKNKENEEQKWVLRECAITNKKNYIEFIEQLKKISLNYVSNSD